MQCTQLVTIQPVIKHYINFAGYLADDFRLAGRGRPGSRSAASMMLDIPRTTTSLGDRAFAVAGPRVWNW